ncbi:MAG TPA: hypothetical protein PK331_17795 [Gordonia sp. (in: high G+C Gram-positive bacteria)]|uniref:hypothetical protein n=1 Tax=unclassified Gordonia (in: high G+C Gram-positive bacteria) TaxID=2657482 RepID=UPI000FC23235|nr:MULTISPECIES: hypothetical protein [unclassified Gordonia (in: high G+C Gram-positive bacteria)]RUP41588.1 MAG: hypothetical protein EKK60_00800 [Gordonia sp. (in: high G+C Gram-positive bacteria)]HNP56683.1 hypothetical protein [Gordonia sp. (in: high G+C Gram-positive bacteria)]HRC52759.1 hypothetical protein [Gordonia sp. (in: high G+C Gram-positive bacteria)]
MKLRHSVAVALAGGALAVSALAAPAAIAAPEPAATPPATTVGSLNYCIFDITVLGVNLKLCA